MSSVRPTARPRTASAQDRSLATLHARSDALAGGDDRHGRRWTAHAAVLDRLSAMRRGAEASGWTSLAVERDAPGQRFRLYGVAPDQSLRVEVPDPFDGAREEARR